MGTQGRSLIYPASGFFHLRVTVEKLSKNLGRPVSAKDLANFFKSHPEECPALLQSLGQCLIKASRPTRGQGIPKLYRIGMIARLAYYGADSNPVWIRTLETHRAGLILNYLCSQEVPERLSLLRDSDPALAAAAGRGWGKIAFDAAKKGASHPQHEKLLRFVGTASTWSNEPLKEEPISRVQAAARIRDALSEAGVEIGNINRHLARLAPPLLFERLLFNLAQVHAYSNALLFPEDFRFAIVAKAWTITNAVSILPLMG